MDFWKLVVPLVTAAAGAAATWLSMRHQWSHTVRSERLEAARKLVSLITKVQFAIGEELESRANDDGACFDEIDRTKAALIKCVADSRLIVGEDIYRRVGNVLESIDRDADCLDDDGWRHVGFTWEAMDDLLAGLHKLVPGLCFEVPSSPFKIESNRFMEYAAQITPKMVTAHQLATAEDNAAAAVRTIPATAESSAMSPTK